MLNYENYGLNEDQAKAVTDLSDDQLEYAYRIRQRRYLIEDAENHALILLEDRPEVLDKLTEGDYEVITDRFEDERDSNMSENAQWDDIIWSYLREMGYVQIDT